MAIINTLIKKLNNSFGLCSDGDLLCEYPKVVLFVNTSDFIIVDVKYQDDEYDCALPNGIVKLDSEIVYKIIKYQYVWMILRTGELIVLDLHTRKQIRISIDNLSSKLCQLKIMESSILLMNESIDCYLLSYSTKQVIEKINEGLTTLNASYEKVQKHGYPVFKDISPRNNLNGIDAYIEVGSLVLKCPVTGITDYIPTNAKYVVPWGSMIAIGDDTNMKIVSITDMKIVYEFESSETQYYPLEMYENVLYYVTRTKTEVCVCSAWITDSKDTQNLHKSDSNNLTPKLTSEETLKFQLNCLLDTLSTAEATEILPHLLLFFDKINDFSFLIKCALKLCQHNIVYRPVLYLLQKRLFVSNNTSFINELIDIVIKADLIEYINFRGNNYYENINLFVLDFKQLYVTIISKSDLDLASICWLKYSELQLRIDSDDIAEILNSVPHNIKLSALIIWFRNFIPTLLDQNPYNVDIFVKWTIDRVFLLEKSSYWPKIGIKFVDDIITVLETSLKNIHIRPISMDELDKLKDHINYITELKTKYKINMLLGELYSQSPNEVALIMLRRCYTEDLKAFLQNYLPPYVARYSFALDDTLHSFIENESASSGGAFNSDRLQILLNAFLSPTNKLESLLQVLKVLDVPWDNNMIKLAIDNAISISSDFTATETDHGLAQEIMREINFAKVKVILKKYNFPLTCTDYTLVLHKIMKSTVIDLDDLKVVTGVLTVYTNYGNILYIDCCLRVCETRIALDYFHKLLNKEKKILLKTVLSKYEQLISSTVVDTIVEKNCIDFLKGTQLLNAVQLTAIKNMYHLKNSHNVKLNLNDIFEEKSCSQEAALGIHIDKKESTSSSDLGRCRAQLTYLPQSQQSKLHALLRRTSTTHEVRNLVEILVVKTTKEDRITSVLSQFKDGHKSSLLIECYNVIVQLVINCDEELVHDLSKHLFTLNALINANIIVKNLSIIWKFQYVFLPITSIAAMNDLINYYTATVSDDYFVKEFGSVCSKSDLIPFRIISDVVEGIANYEKPTTENLDKAKDKITRRLLMKIIASHNIDEVLITSLLLVLFSVEENNMGVIDLLRGQQETIPPYIMSYLSAKAISRTFGLDNILTSTTASCPPQYILQSKFNINLDEIALPDVAEETWDVKAVLFYVLKLYPFTTFERLGDLCRTLNLSLNYGLSLQLIALLSTWELKYKVVKDVLDCQELIVESNEIDLLINCCKFWDSIENKDFIKDILNDFWKNGEITLHGRLVSINPYYYEIYLCIFHLLFGSSMESRSKKEYFLLNFLKEYKRKGAPKQYEFEMFSIKGLFPEIGHYRLPFLLFMRDDMWLNLKSEITLETYERWLPAVALLTLDADPQTARDMICSNALKQTMTCRKHNDALDLDSKESEPWRLTTREEPLLRAAHRCVKYIANMEWAGACLFYVLQGCARGADQVAAAQLCYHFAQKWTAVQPGKRAVREMERLHTTLSTRHALHKIEWALDEFVRLSTEPAQLIRALYLHSNFVEKMSRHDINRAVNEIADKNGINVSSIRIQILENLLGKCDDENKKITCLDNKELMTAKYILKATCPKMGAIYLSRIVFDDESDFNKCKKLRALQCLMSIIESDAAVKVTNRERVSLWEPLLELLHIVSLENIDMPWVVATYVQDKCRALEQLVQSVVGNVSGLKIATDLARRYGDSKIIRALIPLLLRAGLHDEIIPLLLKVISPPDEIIYNAWRTIILNPFQRADYPITERQRIKCLNAINLLPVCPVIKDEDLIEIWKNCVRCKCFGIGCLVLPYMTLQSREKLIELQKIDRRNLIASLKNLHTETYLVSSAMLVLENMHSRGYRR